MDGELPTLNKVWLVSRWLDCHRLQMQFCRLHRGAFVQLLLLWELYVLSVCCSRRHPACNAHASYCHLWPVRFYYIFLRYLIKGTTSGAGVGELSTIKCVFCLQGLAEIFLILRTERDMIKNVYGSLCKVPVILVRFQWNLNFSGQIFEKYSNSKFHENLSSGSGVVLYWRTYWQASRQTDGQTWPN